MKRPVTVFLIIFAVLILMSCVAQSTSGGLPDAHDASVSSAAKQERQDHLSSLTIDSAPVNLNDLDAVTMVYLNPLIPTGHVWFYSWGSAADIQPDHLIQICAYNNFLNLPMDEESVYLPEYANAPAEQVEASIQRHFDVQSEYLKNATYYEDDGNGNSTYFLVGGFGGGWWATAMSARQEGERIIIGVGITKSGTETGLKEGEIQTPFGRLSPVGTLTLQLNEDNVVQYLSYDYDESFVASWTHNSQSVPGEYSKIDVLNLDELTQTYVHPLMPSGSILVSSWEKAEEIAADNLICFCAFNNLLNKPVNPSSATIFNGAEYIDHEGPAADVEAAIQKYFDVSREYLRTSKLYNFHDEDAKIQYKDSYLLPDGFGGGGSVKAMIAEQNGSQLIIIVGIFGPDNLKNPAMTGRLTIQLREYGFQYVSYELLL